MDHRTSFAQSAVVSRARIVLSVLLLALTLSAALAAPPATNGASARGEAVRLLFTGDILLSRQVQQEWQRSRRSPWSALAPLLQSNELPQSASAAEIQQGLLFVRTVNFEGESLYLASCGDNVQKHSPAAVDRWLLEATAGVRRILAA